MVMLWSISDKRQYISQSASNQCQILENIIVSFYICTLPSIRYINLTVNIGVQRKLLRKSLSYLQIRIKNYSTNHSN